MHLYLAMRVPTSKAFNENSIDPRMKLHSCGEFSMICEFCGALRWRNERNTFCCKGGKVTLPHPPPPPPAIVKYYDYNQSGRSFLPFSRAYNNALTLASIGCKEHILPGFSPTFTIQGKLYHRMGHLLPEPGESPVFGQIFFHDCATELQDRLSNFNKLDRNILDEFQNCLHNVNSYVISFKYAIELCTNNDEVKIVLDSKTRPVGSHVRTYNVPTANEVAALLPGDTVGNLDVIVHCRDGDGREVKRISTCHRSYDPLHYVLMFPSGCDGWHLGMTKAGNKKLTAADFYSYRLQIRNNDFNISFKMKRLMQQYAVDQWAKIEEGRLDWARLNQSTIRAEKYSGLLDAINAVDTNRVGRKIILPPTIYGSPRFFSEAFQDAMAIVRKLGKPDLFITFTCNPRWPEILNVLNPGEQACDRPDLTCRVFKLKFDSLMDDIVKHEIFGVIKGYTVTIEFQKRGLPHAHILLILSDCYKPKSRDMIDNMVSAEIPDPEVNPDLHEVITTQNIHGPCGNINPRSPCMVDGRCSKQFPKEFQSKTKMMETSYPLYMRRNVEDGGRRHIIKIHGNEYPVDNSFVVPYNPFLSLKYHAHINVEIVCTVQVVKYLYKYITKGQDRVQLQLSQEQDCQNEIEDFLNARYISSSEAFWRLYGFEIHRKYPPVEKLPCHLPHEQTVIFEPQNVQQVVDRGPPETKLTAFFKKNQEDPAAQNILYPDFPQYFTYNSKDKMWQRRKRGVANECNPGMVQRDTIGRIPTISLSPFQSEIYYLRMLLHHRSGATSFEELRTINGQTVASFEAACNALGLLDDDTEKDKAMEEASSVKFGPQLRQTFATILIYCRPASPIEFWTRHKIILAQDLMGRNGVQEITPHIENQVLSHLQDILDTEGLDLEKDFGLPRPEPLADHNNSLPRIVQEELNFDVANLENYVQNTYPCLNLLQKQVFDNVLDSVNNNIGTIFALDASGGTGKTHVINLLLSAVRSQGKIALATALSGIAATLLSNGRTFHSRCKVPINLTDSSTCNVTPRDGTGILLSRSDLLIIDEISMGHKHIFEAIDRTLRDIRDINMPFGGMTVLLAGDWRQILPVVRHGFLPEIVNATLKYSYLWQHVKVLSLKENMRVILSNESADFSNFLLRIGNGTESVLQHAQEFTIKIPNDLRVTTEKALLDFVFDGMNENYANSEWMSSRAIICATNVEVDKINDIIMASFPGNAKFYKSCDTVEENAHQYPTEFLNKICASGMPPHKLTLKKHSIIMLLRNLDATNGHCNGTRYIVEDLHDHIIVARISCGPHTGKQLFIPRIPIIPSDNSLPFVMKRKQFPVRPSFAITANKAQGQTLKRLGISLRTPFFSHGQLYVAMSRVGSRENLKIFINHNQPEQNTSYTKNVVYKKVLR